MSSFIRIFTTIATLTFFVNGCAFLRENTRPHSRRSIGAEIAFGGSIGEAPIPNLEVTMQVIHRRDLWRFGLGGRATAIRSFMSLSETRDRLALESAYVDISLCRAASEQRMRPHFVGCGVLSLGRMDSLLRVVPEGGFVNDSGFSAAGRLRAILEVPMTRKRNPDGGRDTLLLIAGVEGTLNFTRALVYYQGDLVWDQPLWGLMPFVGLRLDASL